MRKTWLVGCVLLSALVTFAETIDPSTLSQEESAAVAAILANAQKEAALPAKEAEKSSVSEKQSTATQIPEPEVSSSVPQQCLTVAFVDIDEAFNAHPRTVAVKEQIRLKILAKEEEVRGAKQLIQILTMENNQLATQLNEIKPFYERVVVEPQKLQPLPIETQDTLSFDNLINRLTFAGALPVTTSPLNTPAREDELTSRIAANKQIIQEREFFIDNYRYQTREEILQLEKKEVNEILQDIYSEIKSFAKKRNIGAIVRKDEVLYGEKPVNVTQDFINRLKKSKKYNKRGK